MAEIKPSAAAVSVAASRIACASLPPWAFTRSIVSLRKITEIIWKVEALPSPAVRNSTINTREEGDKVTALAVGRQGQEQQRAEDSHHHKVDQRYAGPTEAVEIALPIERASANERAEEGVMQDLQYPGTEFLTASRTRRKSR